MTPLPPRRLILFAGYSPAGSVEAHDLNLLAELTRFGEVHALYDNEQLENETQASVGALVASLTTVRHNEYDFGSWKRLITQLGAKTVESFDELVLVNDSVLILGSLEPLFRTLTDSDADFFAPMLIDEDYGGPAVMISDYLHRYPFELNSSMFTSFFWSMRKSVFTHYAFRNLIDMIGPRKDRVKVSHDFERGFSRTIFRQHFAYETYVHKVYPHSAVYTETAFLLASLGFPVIKKKALRPVFYPVRYLDERTELLRSVVQPQFAAGLDVFLAQNDRSRRKRPDKT